MARLSIDNHLPVQHNNRVMEVQGVHAGEFGMNAVERVQNARAHAMSLENQTPEAVKLRGKMSQGTSETIGRARETAAQRTAEVTKTTAAFAQILEGEPGFNVNVVA